MLRNMADIGFSLTQIPFVVRDSNIVLVEGSQVTISSGTYKVTKSTASAKEVTFVKSKSSKKTSVSIPATVKIDGYTYNVTEIAAKAFKNNKKIKTVTIGKKAFLTARNLRLLQSRVLCLRVLEKCN